MIKKDDIYISDFEFIDLVREYSETIKVDKSIHTLISYLGSLDQFFHFINVENIDNIFNVTPSDIRKYQADLKKNGNQASTVNSKTRPLSAFYGWLEQDGKVESNPFSSVRKLKETKKEKSFLNDDEIRTLLDHCKNLEQKLLFIIMLYTGVRRSELVNIRIEDIEDNQIYIFGKGSKERFVYVPDNIVELINQYIVTKKHGDSKWLFPSPFGGNYTTRTIANKLDSIMAQAGFSEKRIDEITPHSMRRTAITNWISENINMATIQRMAGHQNIQTTMIYGKVRNETVKNAMIHQKNYLRG